ncbi:hypothetical protein C8R46DRAFT_1225180 [Mycena filopes]|nr:hypothetical protein C8R46DRAFT_1225180 [Mycena filopes]
MSRSPSPVLRVFPPGPRTLLCIPNYLPDAGHEDRWKHRGTFFAIVDDEWKGVVTSEKALLRLLTRYPRARTWNAEGWSTFNRLWTMDCAEYHFHPGDPRDVFPTTPSSTPPSSPSSLTESTARSVSPSPPSLSKADLAELAAFRPPPGPISPRRLQQQFARGLGIEATSQNLAELEQVLEGEGATREPALEPREQASKNRPLVKFAIPRFHAAAHHRACQVQAQATLNTSTPGPLDTHDDTDDDNGPPPLEFAIPTTVEHGVRVKQHSTHSMVA